MSMSTYFCRFCYTNLHTLYPVRLYSLSLNEGLIMCANQSCPGLIGGQVDLLKLLVPLDSSSSLTFEQYQQTPYFIDESLLFISDLPNE